jgi:hypothetical protein
MNASDPVRDQLAGLLQASAERDFRPGRQQSLKEHVMSEIRTEREAGRAPARRYRRRVLAVGAVAAIGAAAAVVTAVATSTGSVPAGRARAAAPVTAAQLLDKVANAAAVHPAAAGSGRYWYIQTQVAGSGSGAATAPPAPPTVGRSGSGAVASHERQVWLDVRGACFPGELNEPAHGLRDAPLTNGDLHGPCRVTPGFELPTQAWLNSLPTDPHVLLSMLSTANEGDAHEMFVTIGDLFDQAIVPPKVSAALFRTAALIPGVTVGHGTKDTLGRPTVSVTEGPANGREAWLFDPSTLQYLGSNEYNTDGSLTYGQTITAEAFVGHLGEVPAHS